MTVFHTGEVCPHLTTLLRNLSPVDNLAPVKHPISFRRPPLPGSPCFQMLQNEEQRSPRVNCMTDAAVGVNRWAEKS